jgi:hypothetical protein
MYTTIKRIGLIGLTLLGLSSCREYLDVNTNPNAPINENLTLSAKFPAALVSTTNYELGALAQIGAFWGGYWGTTSEGINLFVDLKSYNGPAIRHQRDGIPVWENGYTTLLYYQLIREQAQAEGNRFYVGAAKIMQGWHFLRLVDFYNNLPFDDALQGTQRPTPRYEDGKTVYTKAINLITEGIADMKAAPAGTQAGSDDVLFGGNTTRWAKFGNTIKLRALLRQSEVADQGLVTAELEKIRAEGSGFLGAGETAAVQPGYLNTSGKLNPLWESNYRTVQGVTTGNYVDLRPTTFAVEQYKSRNDPRLSTLYVPVGTAYKGVLFGNPNVDAQYNRAATSAFRGPQENAGRPAALFKSATQPSVLLGSFESLFLQAEAAQRGWLTGVSAKTLYESAIQESFSYMEVPATAFTAYNAQLLVSFDGATNKIERIIEQKWLALNSISSLEAWNDYRRLGIPNIPNSLQAPAPTARPLRLMYPETERMTNNTEASKQGNDDIIQNRVWWDK